MKSVLVVPYQASSPVGAVAQGNVGLSTMTVLVYLTILPACLSPYEAYLPYCPAWRGHVPNRLILKNIIPEMFSPDLSQLYCECP